MNEAIKSMLDRYDLKSTVDHENALKEITQEITLLGLWRAKFFEKAAMYGGSALRILYGLDRFSEDLDFSLYRRNKEFSISKYCGAVKDELRSFGFSVEIGLKEKTGGSNIESAFIKGGTLKNMLVIDVPESLLNNLHPKKMMKIKLEVDIDPPGNFDIEAKYIYLPVPFSINAYTRPNLFAGKMHAILCRSWVSRVKGRDWYDLIWYAARGIPVHLKHLESRMRQTKHFNKDVSLTEGALKEMLLDRIDSLDFDDAGKDVGNFIKDTSSLELWSKDYFKAICEKIKTV